MLRGLSLKLVAKRVVSVCILAAYLVHKCNWVVSQYSRRERRRKSVSSESNRVGHAAMADSDDITVGTSRIWSFKAETHLALCVLRKYGTNASDVYCVHFRDLRRAYAKN